LVAPVGQSGGRLSATRRSSVDRAKPLDRQVWIGGDGVFRPWSSTGRTGRCVLVALPEHQSKKARHRKSDCNCDGSLHVTLHLLGWNQSPGDRGEKPNRSGQAACMNCDTQRRFADRLRVTLPDARSDARAGASLQMLNAATATIGSTVSAVSALIATFMTCRRLPKRGAAPHSQAATAEAFCRSPNPRPQLKNRRCRGCDRQDKSCVFENSLPPWRRAVE